jgi:hypothetical protein
MHWRREKVFGMFRKNNTSCVLPLPSAALPGEQPVHTEMADVKKMPGIIDYLFSI